MCIYVFGELGKPLLFGYTAGQLLLFVVQKLGHVSDVLHRERESRENLIIEHRQAWLQFLDNEGSDLVS